MSAHVLAFSVKLPAFIGKQIDADLAATLREWRRSWSDRSLSPQVVAAGASARPRREDPIVTRIYGEQRPPQPKN
jgi:hypothetical protein